MHHTQKSIFALLENKNSIPLKLRWIGTQINEGHPQNVKYHLEKLEQRGLVEIDYDKKEVIKVKEGASNSSLIALPIYGKANCGSATSFAEDNIQGFLKISKKLLEGLKTSSLFVLQASGDSMNKASIKGDSIDDGDFVLIDKKEKTPKNGDCIVSVIDDCANIKKFFKKENEIALVSESTKDYSPIFIHEDDNYLIAGKVVKVVKKPSFD